jgi:hypothetical protein
MNVWLRVPGSRFRVPGSCSRFRFAFLVPGRVLVSRLALYGVHLES